MQAEQQPASSPDGVKPERGIQLRLFPPPKPLLDRFGPDFFRRVPPRPGVYLMGGQAGQLLYVGQSRNLRARLNHYKNLNPDRAPRKLTRLVHQVRSITWEICGSPEQAQVRENQLLRLLKPRFNVMNTRPEHYGFVAVRTRGLSLEVQITRWPVAAPNETSYGAFKSLGRVRRALVSLSRLVWTLRHPSAMPHEIPSALIHGPLPEKFYLHLPQALAAEMGDTLRSYLSGQSEELLEVIAARLPHRPELGAFWASLREQDLECLREFYRRGPQRNRQLRQWFDLGEGPIQQEELDHLLVIHRQDGPRLL